MADWSPEYLEAKQALTSAEAKLEHCQTVYDEVKRIHDDFYKAAQKIDIATATQQELQIINSLVQAEQLRREAQAKIAAVELELEMSFDRWVELLKKEVSNK